MYVICTFLDMTLKMPLKESIRCKERTIVMGAI